MDKKVQKILRIMKKDVCEKNIYSKLLQKKLRDSNKKKFVLVKQFVFECLKARVTSNRIVFEDFEV